MLIIKPVEDIELRREYARACDSTYISEDFLYFAADADVATFEVRRMLGFCQFTFESDSAVIHTFKSASGVNDDEAMQLLGRTVANFIYRCGSPFARFSQAADYDERIAKMLGFSKDQSDNLSLDVKKFYETPCSGRNNSLKDGNVQ